LVDAARLLCGAPVWLSGAAGGTLVHGASVTTVIAFDVVVRGVGPAVPHRLPQLDGVGSPTPVIDWVADSDATNHTTPHPHLLTQASFACPPFIVVGNGFVLPVTSVGDSVLPVSFYLNDVLLALDLIRSLLSVRRFTTDNSCSIKFDPFGLSVKDLAIKRVLARYDSTGSLYTLPLPTMPTTTPCVVPSALATTASIKFDPFGLSMKDVATKHVLARYDSTGSLYTLPLPTLPTTTPCVVSSALATTASFATWHHRLGHPGPHVLSKLSSTSAITCPRGRDDSLCHAC
jgi:hypothetical protein